MCLICVGDTLTGCRREYAVVRQATWTCVSQFYRSPDPNIQTVEFRFVDNPREFEVDPAMFLCDDLKQAAEPVAELRFIEVRSIYGLNGGGTRLSTINGKEYKVVAGWDTTVSDRI